MCTVMTLTLLLVFKSATKYTHTHTPQSALYIQDPGVRGGLFNGCINLQSVLKAKKQDPEKQWIMQLNTRPRALKSIYTEV